MVWATDIFRILYRSCPLFEQGRQLCTQTVNGMSHDRICVNTVKIHLNNMLPFTFLCYEMLCYRRLWERPLVRIPPPHTDCYNHQTLLFLQKSCEEWINNPLWFLYQVDCLQVEDHGFLNGAVANDSYCSRSCSEFYVSLNPHLISSVSVFLSR